MKRTCVASLPSVLAYFTLVTFGTASAEAAGIVSIEYQITGGNVVNPPGSVVTSGMYTVEFSALGTFTLVSGAAILKSFSFSGYDIYVTYGDTISTAFNVVLNGEVAGNGTAGGRFSNAVSAFFSGPARFHCEGGTCEYAGFTSNVMSVRVGSRSA